MLCNFSRRLVAEVVSHEAIMTLLRHNSSALRGSLERPPTVTSSLCEGQYKVRFDSFDIFRRSLQRD